MTHTIPGTTIEITDPVAVAVLDIHDADEDGDCVGCGVDTMEDPIPWPCATACAVYKVLNPAAAAAYQLQRPKPFMVTTFAGAEYL